MGFLLLSELCKLLGQRVVVLLQFAGLLFQIRDLLLEFFNSCLWPVSSRYPQALGYQLEQTSAVGTYCICLEAIAQARLDGIDSSKQVLVLRLEVFLALIRLLQLFPQCLHLLVVPRLRVICRIQVSRLVLALYVLQAPSQLRDLLAKGIAFLSDGIESCTRVGGRWWRGRGRETLARA